MSVPIHPADKSSHSMGGDPDGSLEGSFDETGGGRNPTTALIEERIFPIPGGGILYDPACVEPPMDRPDFLANALFDRSHWASLGALEEFAGGRGSVALIRAGGPSGSGNDGRNANVQAWVLRHYRRGGWAARLSADRYLWLGADRTRSFMEWRLLAQLRRRGLPVPHPVAACYMRGSFTYQADLLTRWLPATRTLAEAITGAELPSALWSMVGRTIAAFHREGVQHADLNAGNILLREDVLGTWKGDRPGNPAAGAHQQAPVHLLDFDRGRIRVRGAWEAQVLARLERSLYKIRRLRKDVRFSDASWRALMAGYDRGLCEPALRRADPA
jgi:3-deoxy-D-manno-octulosonic acid kinase